MNWWLFWTAFGSFCVGVLVGRELDDFVSAVMSRRRSKMSETTVKKQRSPDRLLLTLLMVCVLANAVIGALLIKTRADTGHLTECVAAYNQQFSQAYLARATASQAATDSLDRLLLAVAKQDRAEFQKALNDYNKLRADYKAQITKSPLPALPEDYCSEEGMTK